jgi:putative ABC transport system permease protein
MKLWIRLALRNALRNRRRTLLTAATVLLACAMLTVALSWIEGVFGGITGAYAATSGHARIVDEDFAAREILQPLEEHIPAADALAEALRGLPGVVDVQPRIVTGAVITATEEIGDEFTQVVGASDAYYRRHLQGPDRIVAGAWLSGAKDEVVLGRKVAERASVAVGGEVLLLGRTQYGSMSPVKAKVVGVVAGDVQLEMQAFLPLEEVRWMTDIPDGAVELLVYAESMDARAVGPLVERLRGRDELAGAIVQAWYGREPWASMTGMIRAVRTVIELMILFIAALAIFNTMTMAVLERRAEIGVMRAMGLTRAGALGLFVVESMVIGLIGGVAGTALGSVGGYLLETRGVNLGEDLVERMGSSFPMQATFYGDLTPGIMATAVGFGLLIAVVGALLPALRAANIQPVTAMRARR